MAKHRTYTENDLRYLKMLARMFPTVRAAATEIINLNAIMNTLSRQQLNERSCVCITG